MLSQGWSDVQCSWPGFLLCPLLPHPPRRRRQIIRGGGGGHQEWHRLFKLLPHLGWPQSGWLLNCLYSSYVFSQILIFAFPFLSDFTWLHFTSQPLLSDSIHLKVDSFNSLMTLQYVHAGITSVLLLLAVLYFPRFCRHNDHWCNFHNVSSVFYDYFKTPTASLRSHQATLQLRKEPTLGENSVKVKRDQTSQIYC